MFSTDQICYFLHVYKTGGTSIYDFLDTCLPTGSLYKVYAAFSDENFHAEINNLIKVIKLPPETRIVFGHYPFGVHEVIGKLGFYIAFVRNPFQQYISAYNDAVSRGFNQKILNNAISFEEFLINPLTWNMQSYFFTGIIGSDLAQLRKEDALKAIKQNIEKHFRFVGLYEEFKSSLQKTIDYLGLNNETDYSRLKRLNKSESLLQPENLPETLKNKILEVNQIDFELYEYVKHRFHSNL